MSSDLRFPRGLYGLTPEWDDTDRLLQAIDQAAAGGMVALQWRRKTVESAAGLTQARQLRQRCQELGVLFIVNDDWRLASVLDADGVHLGRDDGSLDQARVALGADKILGSSCYDDLQRARQALDAGVDYIAFGAMYPSRVKPAAVRARLEILGQARTLAEQGRDAAGRRVAVVAIGGITPDNAAAVVEAGADSIALISGLFEAADIGAAARRCQALFDQP